MERMNLWSSLHPPSRDGVRNPKGILRYVFEQRGAVQGTVPLMEIRDDQMDVEADLRQASFMASDDGL